MDQFLAERRQNLQVQIVVLLPVSSLRHANQENDARIFAGFRSPGNRCLEAGKGDERLADALRFRMRHGNAINRVGGERCLALQYRLLISVGIQNTAVFKMGQTADDVFLCRKRIFRKNNQLFIKQEHRSFLMSTCPMQELREELSARHRKSTALHMRRTPRRYFQTDSAISLMKRSLFHCSSSVRMLPSSVEEKPHWGLRQS